MSQNEVLPWRILIRLRGLEFLQNSILGQGRLTRSRRQLKKISGWSLENT